MKFREFAGYLKRIEETPSRNKMTEILAELLKKAEKGEVDKMIYLLLGQLAPAYENVVFNLAERMMMRALAEAFQKDLKTVQKLYKEKGDLGIVAEKLATAKGGNLSVSEVYDKLRAIALYEGTGSQEVKLQETAKLLAHLDPLSARFVARIPVGRLRLGFSDKTIIDALSWMLVGDKSKAKEIEAGYQVLPDVGKLAQKIKRYGLKKTQGAMEIEINIPVMPMLAQRLKSPEEMIKKMGQVAVEPKFDGLRVQIHFKRGTPVRAFTRNLNDISPMFPELQELGKYLKGQEVILDSEAIGLDPKTKQMVNFQTTMQRRRKYAVVEHARDIPLKFQIFDLIYKDGQSYMQKPYLERRKELARILSKNNLFIIDEYLETKSSEIIRKEHQKQLKAGLEGVIVKKAQSKYVPGRTGWRWVKMKEVEEASGKLADTIDAVIMGYTAGKGKRTKFGIGQFLAGVKDKDKFKTITKVGTGLTDVQFRELSKRLLKIKVADKPKAYEVHKDLEPDFWVLPEVVVEVAADEITKSPKHTAGLALRFPRLIRFRDDKNPNQATTSKELKGLFKL